MATVANLIEQLKAHDPNEPIVFQYMVQEYTPYFADEFEDITNYLMANDQFAQDSAELFISWMSEARSIIEELEKEEE
jgi:hypothetical protein